MAARAAAGLFRVSVSYIYKALIRRRRTGEVSASSRRGHRPRKLSPAQEAALAAHIEARPDLTLAALQAWLFDEHGVRLSNGAMWSAVARLGLSFKNVWPAPSARGLCETIRPVCINVSGLGATAPAKMEVRAPWSS
jgi:transposase